MGSTGLSNTALAGRRFRRKLAWALGLGVVLAALVARWMLALPASADAADNTAVEAALEYPVPVARARAPRVVVDWPVVVERDPFYSDRVLPPAQTNPNADAAAVAEQARQSLRFTGTILGEQPKAMVNRKLYRKGEVVGGFRIVQIENREIVVERGGVSVRLTSD
jgi:hypothetical protein